MFSASSLDRLMSASGKWIDGNKSYLYEVAYERNTGIPLSASENRNFRLGRQCEPMAIEWLRENRANMGHFLNCDRDFTDKPFLTGIAPGFGFSPDSWLIGYGSTAIEGKTMAEAMQTIRLDQLVEIKTCISSEERSKIFSQTLPIAKKIERVLKEHLWQIIGYFIGAPTVHTVYLLKWDVLDEDNELDDRSPLDPSRGILFEFKREELPDQIQAAEKRVRFADAYLNSGADIEKIQEAWDEAHPKPEYEKNLEKTNSTLL